MPIPSPALSDVRFTLNDNIAKAIRLTKCTHLIGVGRGMSGNINSKADTKHNHTFDAPTVVKTLSSSAGQHGESAKGNRTIRCSNCEILYISTVES